MKEPGKKSSVVLFILRLFFYFSVMGLIFLHPGISVSFDRIGLLQWFIIIPAMALTAFLSSANFRKRCIIAAVLLVPLSIIAAGFNLLALAPFFAGVISFSFTYLLFFQPRWAKLSILEPFFLTWICLRLLALSRSGEEIAGQSIGLTQFILVWTGVVFLFYGVVVYFCLFPQSRKKAGREGAVFCAGAAAALLLVLVVLPPDFVRNTIIENLLPQRVQEKTKSDSEHGIPRDGRREGRRTTPQNGNGRQPGLRGVSEYDWQSRRGRGGSGENRQYMVMVVAADREPLYMGYTFSGQLDPAEGFLVSRQEQLNNLANQRLFVTWFNNEQDFDIGRESQEVFALSTLPQKYMPWRPVSIDPTILSENSGPLRYIHQVVSDTHLGDPLCLVNEPSRRLANLEKSVLSEYLEINLSESDIKAFGAYIDNAMKNWRNNREEIIQDNDYLQDIFYNNDEDDEAVSSENINEDLEKIIALLVSFSKYQYNLNMNDDHSIETLKYFLFTSEEGDCVEFSNTLALLGRLAGIPSRVVTGYLAAESLQTQAHIRGLAALREKIPVLQQFPFDNLFMVTNLHSHSWTQFFIPDYGWLDFESTAFSLPPEGTGDFNSWDVVIPLINENRVFSAARKFPWRAVLRAVGIMAVCALVLAYALRYGREFVLYLGTRRGGREGARSLYLLLLARLAADGRPVKPASKTALEYAELFPGAGENPYFKTFASIYTELRWREFKDDAEREERFARLKQEYDNILKTTRRSGAGKWFIRLLSLRGLAYL